MLQSKDRVDEWTQKKTHLCCLQETHFRSEDILQTESEKMEKVIPYK